MKTRLIHFAGSTIAIEYSSGRAAEILDFIYRDIPSESPSEPHQTYTLTEEENGTLVLATPDWVERTETSDEEIAAHLLDRTCYHLADKSVGGILLHAAGLSFRGKGFLLPGPTGMGKSTLTAWLITQGFDYLTDELVYIPYNSLRMQGLTRPLNLKDTAKDLLDQILGDGERPTDIRTSLRREMTPPRSLRPDCVSPIAQLTTIIFPHFQDGKEFSLKRITKAQAGKDMMECLINARNLPEHGFTEIIRLTNSAPSYAMIYRNFDQIGDSLKKLVS